MTPAHYQPVTFGDVPGWADDDHAAAFAAFKLSATALANDDRTRAAAPSLAAAIAAVGAPEAALARAFFEQHFVPHRVVSPDAPGFLTAYYEPVLAGSRTRSDAFPIPLHRRPDDLVNLVGEADRATPPGGLTHARRLGANLVPYPTRAEIDKGALDGRGLELVYVADAVDRFFLQVQGSGVIQFADGSQVRVTYDGKNGHPYTSLGRSLVDAGVFSSEEMSLEALSRWLRTDPARGRQTMWRNRSYVFFREMPGAVAPVGVLDVALTPFRSLAVDPFFHSLALPVFVNAPTITHMTGAPFRRLMVGQDVGSAIRGAQRGDIFAGSGTKAGAIAGTTKHAGEFTVLLPRAGRS